ncbi:MAG: hypothetical protein HC802_09055 [Caldilineaceae bacterium]|nr:hypothetical protein [Caldilineaceae bacterium]
MKPDGSNRLALTADASSTRQYLQPTWAPGADKIAWTAMDATSDGTRAALLTSTFDGAQRTEVTLPFAPFYISWSPGGEQLAYLSSWNSGNQPSMALRLVDLASGNETVRTLAEGQPFYFSWSPDGQQLLTHIGNERIELQLLDGTQTAVQGSTANFPAPQWASPATI